MNKDILKAILRAQIAIEDHGDADKALAELSEIPEGITGERLAQRLKWAKRELESGDIDVARDVYLNEAVDLAMDDVSPARPVSESPYTDGLRARLTAHRQGGVA